MAYRRTARVQARLDATYEQILRATLRLVADRGWSAVSMQEVAATAGVATGTLYRHVASRDELVAEAFRRAAGRELDCIREAAAQPGPPLARLERCLRTFADRALRGQRLSYALLAEPAGAAVETERLAFRASYRQVFQGLLAEAMAAGEIAAHDEALVAAVLTGSMGEALVGPLAPVSEGDGNPAPRQRVDALVAACLRALPQSAPARTH